MGVSVGVLDHFNIRTRNLADTVRFYEDILGLEKGARPDSGVVHHVAFASTGFAGMQQRLKSKGTEFDSRQVPGGDLWQIFVTDPNGVMIELNYEAAKEQGGTSAPIERMDDVGSR